MIKHIFKNIWRLRRTNSWIVLELFVVSVLLWYSLDFLYMYLVDLKNPLGFTYEQVYRVKAGVVPVNSDEYDRDPAHSGNLLDDFLFFYERVREHPAVEDACYTDGYRTYGRGWSGRAVLYDTVSFSAGFRTVTPSYFNVFRIALHDLVSPQDVFAAGGVICTKDLAQDFFGNSNPYGRKFSVGRPDSLMIGGDRRKSKAYRVPELWTCGIPAL
ncbi:MAG: hypothetical protein LUE93_06795 [Bacteroides sp.]|nr:hypothetical protein [Bacteroides sp.]